MTINRITRKDVQGFREDRSLHNYQRVATKSAIYPGQGTALGLAYCGLKLNGEAGELAEHAGKAMRDDGLIATQPYDGNPDNPIVAIMGELTPERHALIVKECGDVLWYISAICNELGVSLSEVAAVNLDKLCDRGERDALQGSGDNR